MPGSGARSDRRPGRLLLLVSAYGLVATAWAFAIVRNLALDLRFEDAYIVLRYARNLLEGHGFVFNPGERVLGVTTPLHTLLSTLYVALGGDAAPAWQNVAGVVALVAQGALVLLVLVRLGHPWVALPAALLVLGNYQPTYLYFGMETHLFAALGLLAIWLHLDSEARPKSLGVVLGLAFLVRYDAALLAGLIGLRELWRTRRFPVVMTIAFAIVTGPWLVFAQWYFGSILPAPASAKGGFMGAPDYLRHVYEHYAVAYGRLLRGALAWLAEAAGAEDGWSRWAMQLGNGFPLVVALGVVGAYLRDSRVALLALYPALHVATYAVIGADPGFAWHYHLLHPYGFLFFALGMAQLARLGHGLLDRLWPAAARVVERPGAMAALVALACLVPTAHLWQQARHRYQVDPLTAQLHEMGAWLGERYAPETSLLQPAIGTLGWQSGLRIVDHAGLVTPGLYFYDDLRATPLDEVVARHRPDLILHSQWSQAEPESLGYEAVHTFETPFRYVVYERAGLR